MSGPNLRISIFDFRLSALPDVSRLHKRVKAENNQEYSEACIEDDSNQPLGGSLEVVLPLRERNGCPSGCQNQKRQAHQQVEKPLRIAKQLSKQVSESAQFFFLQPPTAARESHTLSYLKFCALTQFWSESYNGGVGR